MPKKTLDLSTTPVHFSIFHWNLNSICANNLIKLSLLRAYTAVNQYSILCLSKTFLDRGILSVYSGILFVSQPNLVMESGVYSSKVLYISDGCCREFDIYCFIFIALFYIINVLFSI